MTPDPSTRADRLDLAAPYDREGPAPVVEARTRAVLAHIGRIDPRIGAFEHLDPAGAIGAARAIDALAASGTDLGALMGAPVAVKDVLAVRSMPTSAGSKSDVADIIGAEGTFLQNLRRAGCILLGKVKTVEFAFGGSGRSSARGTPWNPHDPRTHRVPGGSSSGSSAAVAAGMASFAIGSDTGGSVRVPASFCGIVGWKTSKGLFPTDGVFPLSPDLDTIGFLCRSVADAALIHAGLTRRSVALSRPLRGLRVGLPQAFFTDGLSAQVGDGFQQVCAGLTGAGVILSDIHLPEAHALDVLFAGRNAVDLITTLTEARFQAIRTQLGPEIAARMEVGLTLKATEYVTMQRMQNRLASDTAAAMKDCDCWIAPTTPMTAPSVAELSDDERLETDVSRFTRHANYYRLCALSLPMPTPQGDLPTGLQIVCPLGEDERLLSIGKAIENLLGRLKLPDVEQFIV